MDKTYGFKKCEKLCGEITVNKLFLEGDSFLVYPLRVVWKIAHESDQYPLRILTSVPKKKLKHAVDRNRVKRLIRESYRLNRSELREYVIQRNLRIEVAFIWIPSELIAYDKVERKVKLALDKLKGFLEQVNESPNEN
jgi:ribonuclease P protein component